MPDGEIHYARFPINLDSNLGFDGDPATPLFGLFPPTDYDIIDSEIVPISGGRGVSNAVMVVIARRLT